MMVVELRDVSVVEKIGRFADEDIFDYLAKNEQKCVYCGFWADYERGWVKSQDAPKTSPTYWFCTDCLDKNPRLEWDTWKLKSVTFVA